MTAVVGASGDVMAKAKLFDEGMDKDQKPSGTRIARILADFAGEVEETMKEFRKDTKGLEDNARKFQSGLVSLSGISILDEFDEVEILDGKFETPITKEKEGGRTSTSMALRAMTGVTSL